MTDQYDPSQRDTLRPGILNVPDGAVHVIAANTPTILYKHSLGRRMRVVRLQCANNTGLMVWMQIGTYVNSTFTQYMKFRLINGFDRTILESEIPGIRFNQDIYVQCDQGAAAPADVAILPEVMELPGPNG